jgi:hypothetical protein
VAAPFVACSSERLNCCHWCCCTCGWYLARSCVQPTNAGTCAWVYLVCDGADGCIVNEGCPIQLLHYQHPVQHRASQGGCMSHEGRDGHITTSYCPACHHAQHATSKCSMETTTLHCFTYKLQQQPFDVWLADIVSLLYVHLLECSRTFLMTAGGIHRGR